MAHSSPGASGSAGLEGRRARPETGRWRRVAGRRRGLVGSGLPPLIAFICGWALVAWRTAGTLAAALRAATWVRRDSNQYLKIAAHGYQATTHCTHAPAAPGQVVHLCGNISWLPAYPALLRLVSLSGLSLPAAGIVVAWICWYLTLVMVWVLTAQAPTPNRWACLLLAAVFPGQVYFAAVFPISMCTLLMLLSVRAATVSHRLLPCAGAAFVAGATYPLALALAPGLLLAAAFAGGSRHVLRVCVAGAVAVLAGFGAVLGYAQLTVGKWNAYFITEREEYGVQTHVPWRVFVDHIAPLWTGLATPLPGAPPPTKPHVHGPVDVAGITTARQSLLLAIVVALATVITIRAGAHRRPRRLDPIDAALLMTAVTAWIIPYIGGGSVSIYRSEACVLVIVPLLRRLRWWQTGIAVAGATWIAIDLAPLFASNTLV